MKLSRVRECIRKLNPGGKGRRKDIVYYEEKGKNPETKSIFGNSMRFSLKDGKIPILTTKKTAWKTCLKVCRSVGLL